MEINEKLSTILFNAIEQSSETIFITDFDGNIVYVNPSFEKVTGHTPKEVLGKNPRILKSGKHSPEFYKDMWVTIKSGKHWQGRVINKRRDGALYVEETHISPVKNNQGKITHFIVIRKDITKEIGLEQQLFQSQKMESLGILAGTVAHDFNNLLTMIIGSLEVISEDTKKDSAPHTLAQATLKTAKDYTNLTKQLLVFARRQEIVPKIINLNSIINETKPIIKMLVSEKSFVEYELEKNLIDSNLEPEQFKQILLNLVSNAKDSMPEGGTIKIRTMNVEVAQDSNIPVRHGKYAVLETSDMGTGMDENTLSHMFEPFFTTKPKEKGTGLGLSTVYGIVKNYQGEILVESEPGKGTTFKIYFPSLPADR
jgi:PAS domain S-box-containing protein